MKVIISPRAEKQLKKVGRTAQIILTSRLEELTRTLLGEEKLSGYRSMYRIRVGDYRIVYERTGARVFVVSIGHRKEIYHLMRELLK